MRAANTIDEVIQSLDEIIAEAIRNRSRLGYFPALYRKVTLKVKEGIAAGSFENGSRMERLDVLFANRYLNAYDQYHHGGAITESWRLAFDTTGEWWPIVLQHLLLGMNAHINLDLGIAAAEAAEGGALADLKNDFDVINVILHDLIEEVQQELSEIWPLLQRLDIASGNVDEFISKFGIDLSRDNAWGVARKMVSQSKEQWPSAIEQLDREVANFGRKIVGPPRFWFRMGLMAVRLGELQAVDRVIEILR